MKIKFISSADGTRIIRVRSIKAARLETTRGNGFLIAKIKAQIRGEGDSVTLAAYTAVDPSPEAENLPSRAQADLDRLCALLNGGRLSTGEFWPSRTQTKTEVQDV